MADAWDEFQDAWDEFDDAPAASVPAGGRRGRGGVDVAAQRSQGRQQRDQRRQQVRDTFSMEHAPETSIAAGEQIAMLGSGAAAELAGLGTEVAARGRRLLGLAGANDPDPKTQRDQITERFTYQPRTPGAAEQLGEAAAPVARLLGPVVDAFGAEKRRFEGVPVLEDLYAAPFLAGESLLATGGQAGGQARNLLRTERAGRDAASRTARQQHDPGLLAAHYGIEVSPTELQAVRPGAPVPMGAQFAERATQAVTSESRARANAPRLNRIAARQMGVEETDLLTPDVFQRAKEPHFAVREEGRSLPDLPTSPDYLEAVNRLRNSEWDPDAAATIHQILGRHEQLGSSSDLVDRITSLRDQATKRMRSDGQMAYKDYEVGSALRRLADSMEEELGRRATAAGDVSYDGRLRQSRRELAKIYSVEDATRADHLDVERLSKAKNRDAFTEDLAVLAHLGERLPKSVAHTQKVGAAPSGVETSAAGIGGALNRFSQNAIRRLMGERAMGGFNDALGIEAQGLDPSQLFPDAFGPRYDFRSPMRPNDGPQAPVPPPSAPPGLFADAPPAPRTPAMPAAGRPEPSGPAFNQTLADMLAGDLTLEGAPGPVPPARAPMQRPLDTVDFEPPQAPAAPGAAPRGALTQDELRLAPEQPLSLVDQPPASFAAMLDEPVELSARGMGRGIEGDFASQLGAVSDPIMLPDAPGMPNRPRGVAGPRSAQLGGRTPRGFELLDDDTPPPPPPQALFGPDDEFGGAPMPTSPQGPAPDAGAAIAELLGDRPQMLYRGVQEGADPFAPNERNFTTWSDQQRTAGRYGSNVGETPFDPSTNVHLGALEDARRLLGLPAEATAQDIAEAAMRRFAGENRTASYDLPAELDGVPREYIMFGPPRE